MEKHRPNGAAGGSRSEGAIDSRRRIKSENGLSGAADSAALRARHFSGRPTPTSSCASMDEYDDDDKEGNNADAIVFNERDSVSFELGPNLAEEIKRFPSLKKDGFEMETCPVEPVEPYHPSQELGIYANCIFSD